MTNPFTSIPPGDLPGNPFRLIGDGWMLITAGTLDDYNTMTASWGGLGMLWSRPVVYIFIRPQRHTYGFTERFDRFTASFFDESYRDVLNFCGSHSGREVDKAAKTGITPVETPGGSVTFTEARLVIECVKWYYQDIDPSNFLDPGIGKNYPAEDYHRMYVGNISWCGIQKA